MHKRAIRLRTKPMLVPCLGLSACRSVAVLQAPSCFPCASAVGLLALRLHVRQLHCSALRLLGYGYAKSTAELYFFIHFHPSWQHDCRSGQLSHSLQRMILSQMHPREIPQQSPGISTPEPHTLPPGPWTSTTRSEPLRPKAPSSLQGAACDRHPHASEAFVGLWA